MDLHTAGHNRGVVAAPHYAAAEAGRAVLAEGGNALEAMVAMAAVIAVVYPHMNHLGGDGFWLIHEPAGAVRALMAAGRAGAMATPELYREHGYELIPARGPLAALTVPGAVSGWTLACEIAHSLGGRLPRDVLLDPAIRRAREGSGPSRSQIQVTTDKLAELKDVPGFAATFLADGKPPEKAAVLKQTALAATLEHLAHAGFDDFYRGDVGREIAADLEKIGSPVTRKDLEGQRATMAEPLHVDLTSGVLYNTPAPTQGLASLIIPALFERLHVRNAETFDYFHGLVEATKRAFTIRGRTITDPSSVPGRLDDYLSPRFLDAEVLNINKSKAAPWPEPKAKGDTVWLGAAEASGPVVSYIQSLYWEFGSGCVLPSTGVLMQNRGASFSLKPESLRFLAPGRLPFHTLNPALAVLNDGRVIAFGAMGGDGQPQTQAAVLTRHVLYLQPLKDAIDRPRWVLGRTWGAARANLRVEPRLDDQVINQLREAGHDVEVLPEPYSDVMGHAGAVVWHSDRTLEGAHDPRADGGAVGI
jgi:oxamate amidohydrolase